MGNRANVIFTAHNHTEIGPAVYLHWNGGPESIYPFLDELDRRGMRTGDVSYETARFIHVVCDFMDQDEVTTISVGVSTGPSEIAVESLQPYNPGDNGVYVVERGKDKRLVRRFVVGASWSDPLREVSAEEVLQECERANAHPYNSPAEGQSIAEIFGRIRPTVGISA